MIWFACRQCDTRQGRPDEEAGTLIFCNCGTSNRVPWKAASKRPRRNRWRRWNLRNPPRLRGLTPPALRAQHLICRRFLLLMTHLALVPKLQLGNESGAAPPSASVIRLIASTIKTSSSSNRASIANTAFAMIASRYFKGKFYVGRARTSASGKCISRRSCP